MKNSFIVCTAFASLTIAASLPLASPLQASNNPNFKIGYTMPANISAEEQKWYKTFQEGNMLADGWMDITWDILAKLPVEEHPEYKQSLQQLGDKIGREWAKNNDIRKIDTDMLKKWGKELKAASKKNPESLALAINSIDRQVDSILR